MRVRLYASFYSNNRKNEVVTLIAESSKAVYEVSTTRLTKVPSYHSTNSNTRYRTVMMQIFNKYQNKINEYLDTPPFDIDDHLRLRGTEEKAHKNLLWNQLVDAMRYDIEQEEI